MYEQIRQEIKHDYYLHNYSNEGQRFVAWYLRNIHLRDPNQAKDEITDGPDDKQIDAIVIDDDRSAIFIVQSKFLGSDSVGAEPLREVLASWLQLRDLTRLQEVANEKLKRKLAEVAKALEDDYEINLGVATFPRRDSPVASGVADGDVHGPARHETPSTARSRR
jgi:hypothetical protein